MAKGDKYGVNSFKHDFGTEEECLAFLFNARHTSKCSCGGTYRALVGRKQYQCSKCRFQIAPTAGTIFHKSPTPLSLWFHAIFVFSNAKSGISAKELERQLEVTYKTAWRILSLIRKALTKQGSDKLDGAVETDIAYFGGRKNAGKNNERLRQAVADKSIVMAAVERKGRIRAKVMPGSGATLIKEFLDDSVEKTSRLITDQAPAYRNIGLEYQDHDSVKHSAGQYVHKDVYINTVEAFWSHVKRSMKGTFKVVSKKHLQTYLDAFVWHYNNRHNDRQRFLSLLGSVSLGVK